MPVKATRVPCAGCKKKFVSQVRFDILQNDLNFEREIVRFSRALSNLNELDFLSFTYVLFNISACIV